MKRLPSAVAVTAVGLALAGCHSSNAASSSGPSSGLSSGPSSAAEKPAKAATTTPAGSAVPTPTGSASGGLPDICTLLSKAEVTSLTSQPVTLMTKDDGKSPNARYCQWQLGVGQLTVTVTVESRESFDTRNAQSVKVDGIGAAAYSLSGHLFIFAADRDVDVYDSSATSDAADLAVEKNTAATILPRLGS
jgi:hypothetical protein